MKKYSVFFIIITFFIPLFAGERPLLFILGKEKDKAWQLMLEYYKTYFAFESLPKEINQKIAEFLLKLEHPHSFSSSKQQFFLKLLEKCIPFSSQEEEWNFPVAAQLADDAKYLIETSASDNFPYKRVFNTAHEAVSVIHQRKKEKESFFSFLKTIFCYGNIRGSCVFIGQHIFYTAELLYFITIPTIAHIVYSKSGISIERYKIDDAERLSHSYKWNPQQMFFIAPLKSNENMMGCFNFYGKKIIDFHAERAEFTSDGRAILCQNGGRNKKITLYSEDIGKHLQELAYKSLTIAQYSLLTETFKKPAESKQDISFMQAKEKLSAIFSVKNNY
jgi:hypothetical protein